MVENLNSKIIAYGSSESRGREKIYNFIEFENGVKIKDVVTSTYIGDHLKVDRCVEMAYFKVKGLHYIVSAKINGEVMQTSGMFSLIYILSVIYFSYAVVFALFGGTLLYLAFYKLLGHDPKSAIYYTFIIWCTFVLGLFYKLVKTMIEFSQCKKLIK